jgi:hypothetical protein
MSPILGPSLKENLTEADHQGGIENSDREANERLSRAAFVKHHGHLYADTPHVGEASEVEPASPAGTTQRVQASSVASLGAEEYFVPPKDRNILKRTRAKTKIAKAPRQPALSKKRPPRQPAYTDVQIEWLLTERLLSQKDFDGSASANSTLWNVIAAAFKLQFKQSRDPKTMMNKWNIHVKIFRDYCQDCYAVASSGSSRDDRDDIVKPKYADLFETYQYNHRPLSTPMNIACDDDSGSELAPEGEYEPSSPSLDCMYEVDNLSRDHEQPHEGDEYEEGSDPGFFSMRDAMEREQRAAKGKGPARGGHRDEDTGEIGHLS